MPLFIDIHIVEDNAFSEIAAIEGHQRDLAMQHKFGVKNIKFFLNLPEKRVFCLMEAPDKESCAATHREANGIEACNLVEVDGGMYSAFMAYDQALDHGIVMKNASQADTGYRFILTLDIINCLDFSFRCV